MHDKNGIRGFVGGMESTLGVPGISYSSFTNRIREKPAKLGYATGKDRGQFVGYWGQGITTHVQ